MTGAERDRLLDLCEGQHTPGWLRQHRSRLPQQLMTLIEHENEAVTISDFQAVLVPGLLQTGDYARAVISRIATVPGTEVDGRVAARLARQNLFSRERPARFTFYLHEFVLRLPVGDPVVMSEQLHHLLRMSVRPYLSLRVVPATFGAHAGSAGSFTFMEFAEFKPVAYMESETTSLSLEKPEEIAAYRRVLGAMTAPEPDGFVWRTGSYSAGHGDCVEVAPGPDGVLVRDSKDRDGSALTVPTTTWHAFRTTATR